MAASFVCNTNGLEIPFFLKIESFLTIFYFQRLIAPQRMSDEAYWSNPSAASSSAISSSETSMTSSDSESEQRRAASPVSEASSDIADVLVLTKAMHL